MKLHEKINLTVRGYKLIDKLLPGFLLVSSIHAAAASLLPYINIFMSTQIITAIAAGRELRYVLVLAAITILLNFAVDLILKAMRKLIGYNWDKFWKVCDEPIYEKIRTLDYERIEDANTHFMREKINAHMQTNGFGLLTLADKFGNVLTHAFGIIFGTALIAGAFTAYRAADAGTWGFVFEPWFALFIILCIAANIAIDIYSTSTSVKKREAAIPEFQQTGRIMDIYVSYFLNYRAGKDLKLYSLGKLLSVEYGEYVEGFYRNAAKKLYKIDVRYGILSLIGNAALNIAIYSYVTLKAVFGSFGAGSIVLYVGSLGRFSAAVRGFMNNLAVLMENSAAMADYFAFIDIPSKMQQGMGAVEKPAENNHEFEFENVSFKYPGSENYALRNLSMKLKMGQRMAVVGMNGSGKTTMIKLLCRLYDPTEGKIMLNGTDIKEYDYGEYMGMFSLVFQDFKLFSFSLGQNVGASVEFDAAKVRECLSLAGFGERLNDMPKGLETPLYKDFDDGGIEVSGGEAQKIAIARALYKDALFVVLDEPTAALDPIAEHEIYSKFNEIVEKKSVIYISHRLSSCRFCDDIAVFHEGELIQRGSHDALVANKEGKYYEMWNAQAQYYANAPVDSSFADR